MLTNANTRIPAARPSTDRSPAENALAMRSKRPMNLRLAAAVVGGRCAVSAGAGTVGRNTRG